MNALAYQADPTSVTLKVSPHKAKKVKLKQLKIVLKSDKK
jgi:hypothetical protein